MRGIVFHRPARDYPERLPSDVITIASPPSIQAPARGAAAWLQFVLPALGGLGSLAFMATYFTSGRSMNLIIPIAMGGTMLVSVGGGVALNVLQRRGAKKQAAGVRDQYSRYVEQQRMRLTNIARLQSQVQARLYAAPERLPAIVAARDTVWERRPTDDDFLQIRIGLGVVPLCCPLHLDSGSDPLSQFDPDLLALARGVVAQHSQLEDAPITLPLRQCGAAAITGDPEEARALARAMLCAIATLHAPSDVRIVAYFPPEVAPAWRWLKWLPHTHLLRQMKQNASGEQVCLLADNVEEFQRLLLEQVTPEVERRRRLQTESRRNERNALNTALPHFVVVVDGYSPHGTLGHLPALTGLLQTPGELGITVLCLSTSRNDEPPVLQARLRWSGAGWLTMEETAFGGRRIEGIVPDRADVSLCEAVSRGLAPTTLAAEAGGERDLAQDVRLLQLSGLNSADEVSPAVSWAPRAREELLRVPIGIASDGETLLLDIKEAAEGGMGPHGLIIGATGSGKSELLRTIVTSLALGHDPEAVNFVLADFKGGASFADLADLPHTAGMITNIESDLTLVDRMRAALFGEQERRQRMLREAGNLDNIQQYWAKRRAAPQMGPMPHLLIIVDEFAELLSNRPDFLELFVAIGRVGRSLGMHLLLATQRLGEGRIQGLEGHLRYRICLRTFSAQESSAVIGTPDAFYLPSVPGIGYFKVDTTVYRKFKTATISSPYQAAQQSDRPAPVRLRRFTDAGTLVPLVLEPADQSAAQARDATGRASSTDQDQLRTDMDVVIVRLRDAAAQQRRAAVHQVCLPPLAARIPLEPLLHAARTPADVQGAPHEPAFGVLRAPVGLLDMPAEQRQAPLVLDFSGAGGHLALVGATQSGKSTCLQTLVLSLALTHSPRDVQVYCVDLGGGALHHLEDLPHVGAVCGKLEREKMRRLLRHVRGVIEERELFFRQHRIDNMEAYRAQRRQGAHDDQPYGDVFLVVDDLGQLMAEIDQAEADIIEIVASGLAYGVHLVVAARRWAEVRAKIRDAIGTRLELRLNDPTESEMGRGVAATIASAPAGRGIMKGGLQFQTALAAGTTADTAEDWLHQTIERTGAAWRGVEAPPVLMLPMMVTPADLGAATSAPGVPLGLEETHLAPLYIDLATAGPHFMVFGDGESGKTNLLRHWMRELRQCYTPEQVQFAVVDNRRNLLEVLDSPHLFAYACTPPMLKDAVDKLKAAIEPRMLSSGNLDLEQLRAPRRWEGPHYYLFVDDYDTVVPPSGNPLAPLTEAIAQGKDIGFHVVLARKVAGTSRTAYEAVFQRLRETGSPGLIMSGDPQEGALLGTQRAAAMPPGRGFLVRRNQRTIQVQSAYVEP